MFFNEKNPRGSCKEKKQTAEQVIDIALWDESELEPYSEGAREKSKIHCPDLAPFHFLIPNHIYIFKQSNHRYAWQFWVEVIAYRLGCLMNIPVPPAFIGMDSRRSLGGAVIEWFHNYPNGPRELYIPGGDLFQRKTPEYERKKGEKHNICDFIEIIRERNFKKNENWEDFFIRMICFDSLIGNTDRHQDNWGIVNINGNDFFLLVLIMVQQWGMKFSRKTLINIL